MNDYKEFEHYGESLSTHPDYLQMKALYEEELLYNSLKEELENEEKSIKFVSPIFENPLNKEIVENLPKLKNQPNEKNLL